MKKTGLEFNNLAQEKGLRHAFYTYVADKAVILRDKNYLIVGKESIKKNYPPVSNTMKLEWKPGKPDGEIQKSYGNYVSIWKRQKDGSWK